MRILFEFLPEKLKNIRINTIFQLFRSTLFREIDNNEILILRIILSKLGASYLKLYRICRIRNVAPNSVDFGVSFNLVTVKLIRNWLQAGSQYGRKLEINRKCKLFCQVSVQTIRAPVRTMESETF